MKIKKIDFLNGYFSITTPPVRAVQQASPKKEKAYYTTHELAVVLSMSVAWIEKWRHKIVGAQRIGRAWRFDKSIIDACIAKGQDVRIPADLTPPLRGIHITAVHGAVRSGGKKGRNTHGA